MLSKKTSKMKTLFFNQLAACLWRIAPTTPLVTSTLIISTILKILGSKSAEDFLQTAVYQRISDQRRCAAIGEAPQNRHFPWRSGSGITRPCSRRPAGRADYGRRSSCQSSILHQRGCIGPKPDGRNLPHSWR